MTNDPRAAAVMAAEQARCKALVAHDLTALRAIVAPDYQHVHGNGHVEDYAAYFKFLESSVKYRNVDRENLTVRLYGVTAVMSGVLKCTAVMGDKEISVSIMLLQVWVETDGRWRLAAYQGTSLAK